MATPVFDYRTDIANVVVHPEIRARFMRMEPGPAGLMHSHDLGGEIFLVLEGQCEFIVEGEPVTCGPGQLIYIEPRVKHTLHAVGDEPCVIYLSVTPHIEPTHTQYDDHYEVQPPRYGTWRGGEQGDPNPDVTTVDLAKRYISEARRLAEVADSNGKELDRRIKALSNATTASDPQAVKQTVDEMWLGLRTVLEQVSAAEVAWNALAPRAMPPK